MDRHHERCDQVCPIVHPAERSVDARKPRQSASTSGPTALSDTATVADLANACSSLGTNSLRNGRRLNEVNLRAVKHHITDDTVRMGNGQTKPAREVLIVGDHSTILRYDPCAVLSLGECYDASYKWIDMSISYFEDFYGDLYDVHFFDPTVPTRTDSSRPPLAFAVGDFQGRDGNTYSYTRLNQEFGQMVVLRLTAHGQPQPQNSPHGWIQKVATHTCNDADYQYGCWAIVTPPWTEGSDYEIGFTQNSQDLPPCCSSSTVRCYFPEDFLNCYPWPRDLAVRACPLTNAHAAQRGNASVPAEAAEPFAQRALSALRLPSRALTSRAGHES